MSKSRAALLLDLSVLGCIYGVLTRKGEDEALSHTHIFPSPILPMGFCCDLGWIMNQRYTISTIAMSQGVYCGYFSFLAKLFAIPGTKSLSFLICLFSRFFPLMYRSDN